MEPATDTETLQDGGGESVGVRGRGKPLGNSERNAILQALLRHSKNQRLKHGALGLVSKQFSVSTRTVSSIWKRARESVDDGTGAMVVSHKKKNCGRKRKDYSEQIANLRNIPLSNGTCFRSTAIATDCYY